MSGIGAPGNLKKACYKKSPLMEVFYLYKCGQSETPLLKRLELKKLIGRKRSKVDERSVLITLTEKAKALRGKPLLIPDTLINSFSDNSISLKKIQAFQKNAFEINQGFGYTTIVVLLFLSKFKVHR